MSDQNKELAVSSEGASPAKTDLWPWPELRRIAQVLGYPEEAIWSEGVLSGGVASLLSAYRQSSEGASPAPVPPSQEWRAVVQELVAAMRAYEMDVEGPAPQKHRDMMERATALLAGAPSAPAPSQAEASNDDEFVPHAFVSRTPYEPGDDRDIWCRDCEYHRDHEIHAAAPAPSQERCAECGCVVRRRDARTGDTTCAACGLPWAAPAPGGAEETKTHE